MWGVIIFLRFYTIVGHAGMAKTILIVTLSFMVAFLTALALSAIATCGTSHKLAGVYPMLARALGKEVATATGIIYFFGIVCLAVLECLGACEELFKVVPSLADIGGMRLWGFIFLSALSSFVYGGIQIVSKLGLAFFAVVIATLLFLYISLIGAPSLTAMDKPDLKAVATLERILGETEWLVDDTFSVADVAVGSYLNYVPIFFPQASLAQTPNIARYMQRCAARPAFATAFGDGHANLVQQKAEQWLAEGGAPPNPADMLKKMFS